MKNVVVFAVSVAFALSLAGCASGGSGSEAKDEPKTEAIEEISEEDALREYISDPAIEDFHSDAFEDITSMMDSASEGDVNACEAYHTAIQTMCNDVRSADVPIGAEEYHQMTLELADMFENTAVSFLAASHLDNSVQRMGGIDAAADTLGEASDQMKEMADYINEKLNS